MMMMMMMKMKMIIIIMNLINIAQIDTNGILTALDSHKVHSNAIYA